MNTWYEVKVAKSFGMMYERYEMKVVKGEEEELEASTLLETMVVMGIKPTQRSLQYTELHHSKNL